MSRSRVALIPLVAATSVVASMLVSASALAAPVARTTVSATAAAPTGLVPVVVKTSLTGTHRWYRQTFRGLPVLDSYYVQHTDRGGRVISVVDGRQEVPADLAVTPTVSLASAETTAQVGVASTARAQAVGPLATRPAKATNHVAAAGEQSATLAVRGGSAPALVWSVLTRSSGGVSRTLVNARTGALLSTTSLTKNATGRGRVFDPNPVVDLRDESLKDRNDSNQRALWPAYQNVLLPDLVGTGHQLVGRYARVVQARNGLAYSKNNTFVYQRHDHRFEQVNAYYAIDRAQHYIQQLGFDDVNNESQDLIVDTYRGDNSFYDPSRDTITYGIGGVDDAEDNEVVWHEYGHAIQDDQSPGYGTSEQAGATGEGFGDYWAVTMSQSTSRGFDLPCVMDWDSTSYTSGPRHCLRRTDTGKTVKDIDGEVHDDGEIWSNALWDINRALGRTEANRIILESQFYNVPDTTFKAAALNTIASARALYSQAAAAKVRSAFHARGIL